MEIVVWHPKRWTRKHLTVLVHRQRHGTPSNFSISWLWEPGEDENNGNLNFSIATGTFETHVPNLKYLFVTVSQRTPLQLYYVTIAPIGGELLSLETKEWQDGDKKLAVTQNIAESTNTSSNTTFCLCLQAIECSRDSHEPFWGPSRCDGERATRAIEWQQDPPLRYRWRNSLGHTACSKSAWAEAASSPTWAPPCTPAALLPSSSPQLLQILQVSLKNIYFLSPAATMVVRCPTHVATKSSELLIPSWSPESSPPKMM